MEGSGTAAASGAPVAFRRCANWIALSIATLLTLALLEGGACVYLRRANGYDGTHLLNYDFDPYKIIQPAPGYVDTRGVRHNAQGFRRDADTPRIKPPGTLRVFLMGGSTAYGLQSLSRHGRKLWPLIRNDETIDAYLERSLEGALPGVRVEVINAAITSSYSHQHLIYLNQTILKYDPDLVIFLDGFNDYFPYEPGFDQFRDYAHQERVVQFMDRPTLSAWAHYSGWWLFRKSHFAHLAGRAAKNLLENRSRPSQRPRIDVDQALADLDTNARQNFVKMIERNGIILRHEGVAAIFALQPEIVFQQSKPFTPLEVKIRQEIADGWPEGWVEFKNRALPLVRNLLKAATEVSGARFVDLTDIYAGTEAHVYTDYCHLTPDGNRLLASALRPAVLQILEAREAAAHRDASALTSRYKAASRSAVPSTVNASR